MFVREEKIFVVTAKIFTFVKKFASIGSGSSFIIFEQKIEALEENIEESEAKYLSMIKRLEKP